MKIRGAGEDKEYWIEHAARGYPLDVSRPDEPGGRWRARCWSYPELTAEGESWRAVEEEMREAIEREIRRRIHQREPVPAPPSYSGVRKFARPRKAIEAFRKSQTLHQANAAASEIEGIGGAGDRCLRVYVRALGEDVECRAIEAAYRLGFMKHPRARRALESVACDSGQPESLRAYAVEALATQGRRAVPVLRRLLRDPSPEIRFWVVFGLGQLGSRGVRRCLERMLLDGAQKAGYWSVGQEALAMLAGFEGFDPSDGKYSARLESQIAAIRRDPEASKADLRWAERYRPADAL